MPEKHCLVLHPISPLSVLSQSCPYQASVRTLANQQQRYPKVPFLSFRTCETKCSMIR